VAQAGVGTLQGVGGTVSATLAGTTVVVAGYHAAFLMLALIAGLGGLLFFLFMPETRPTHLSGERRRPGRPTWATALAARTAQDKDEEAGA
jgi:hypothetical protein